MMEQQISQNITLNQVIYSNTAKRYGIDNTPTQSQYNACRLLCIYVIEPIFVHFGRIGWSSFFRCKRLNEHPKIKGSKTSDHQALIGAAVDLDVDIEGKCTNAELFHWIKDNIEFDQLIWELGTDSEPAWVHVSFRATGNRKQVKIARKNSKGKTYYEAI
jgi:zinc D-Ala-D-Ala carboxypeptidase